MTAHMSLILLARDPRNLTTHRATRKYNEEIVTNWSKDSTDRYPVSWQSTYRHTFLKERECEFVCLFSLAHCYRWSFGPSEAKSVEI